MTMRGNILVVDDEAMMREAVTSYLEKKGLQVYTAETGEQALGVFDKEKIDFIILDLMLPDISGEEVCVRIREKSKVPILMLTAKTLEEDLLHGLHIGADDYMTKPFSLKELYARMEVIFRRAGEYVQPAAQRLSWNHGDLEVDLEQKRIKRAGEWISLTPLEWNILVVFMQNPRKVFTRNELIELAFEIGYDGYDRVIDTHIKNLRKKLEKDPKQPCYIKTVHGFGYQFGGERD